MFLFCCLFWGGCFVVVSFGGVVCCCFWGEGCRKFKVMDMLHVDLLLLPFFSAIQVNLSITMCVGDVSRASHLGMTCL